MASGTVAVARVAPRASRGLWGDAWRRLLRNRPALLGFVFIGVFVGTAVLAPLLAPHDPGALYPPPPDASSGATGPYPPRPEHLMGQDLQGRDEFTRVVYGRTARGSASSSGSVRSSSASSSAASWAPSPARPAGARTTS